MSHEMHNIVGAETVGTVEGNMCGTDMRGADALPGSMATSRTKGSHRNLGDPAFDQREKFDMSNVRYGISYATKYFVGGIMIRAYI